jgi:5-deoxy-D-glucuronate isomerase
MQLAEYKVSPTIPRTQVTQEKLAQGETKPIAQTGVKAEKPEWKVGYEWRYAWKRPGGSGTFTRVLIREDKFENVPAYVVRVGKNEHFYVKENLGELATLSGGKIASKRSAPYQPVSWPLEVGKEWRNSYTRENIEEKSSETFDYRWSVSSVEELKVPAGIFEAFKIEGYNFYTGNLMAECWYSPKVKWFVKERIYQKKGVLERELINFKAD